MTTPHTPHPADDDHADTPDGTDQPIDGDIADPIGETDAGPADPANTADTTVRADPGPADPANTADATAHTNADDAGDAADAANTADATARGDADADSANGEAPVDAPADAGPSTPVRPVVEDPGAHTTPPPREEPPRRASPPPPQDEPPPHASPPPHDPPPPGGPTTPPPYRTRSLDRRSSNRVVAGVAGGLGDYFNIDPAIFRLGFVVLAVFGGSGFLLYVLGWVFLPERDSGHSVGETIVRRVGGGRSAGGLLLLLVALLVIAGNVGGGGGDLIWAALLIGLGVLLFRQADERGDGPPPTDADDRSSTSTWTDPTPPTTSAASTGGGAVTAAPRTDVRSTPAADPFAPPPPPVASDGWRPTPYTPGDLPTPPSVLGRLTVAAALILIGATALLDTLTGVDVAIPSYAALALTVIGAGLLVGAWWGRARGLITLGGVTLVVLLISSTVTQLPSGTIVGGLGQRVYRPDTVAEIQDPYELGIGEMQIDLTGLELNPGQDVNVEASMSVGSLQLLVPSDVGIEGTASTELGEVDALGRTGEGTNPHVSMSEPATEGQPTITLDLSTTIGQVLVHREGDPGSEIRPRTEVN